MVNRMRARPAEDGFAPQQDPQSVPKAVKEVMDIKELSEYLGIGKSKIYALIRQQKIPASKIGRQYRFSKNVIDSWLKEKIITAGPSAQMALFRSDAQ